MRLDLRVLAAAAGLLLAPLVGHADTQLDFTGTPINVTADADTTTTVSVEGRHGFGTFSRVNAGRPIVGSGAGRFVIDNQGVLGSGMDFSANSGGVRFENRASTDPATSPVAWVLASDNVLFGSGDDLINNHAGAVIIFDDTASHTFLMQPPPPLAQTRVEFGDGDDRFNNEGLLVVGSVRISINPSGSSVQSYERGFSATLDNLDSFDNSGTILMGGWVIDETRVPVLVDDPVCFTSPSGTERRCSYVWGAAPTDGEAASTLAMPGTAYRASGAARIILDADFSVGRSQANCHDRTGTGGGARLVADCIDLSGGSTEGVTQVEVVDRLPRDLGNHDPDGIVIIDVSGGQSAAGHFVMAPESVGYSQDSGGIEKGLFFYPLIYDAARQQHKLVGLPGRKAYQMPLLIQGAQALSRAAGHAWFERRETQRDEDGIGRDGAWARLSHERISREVRQPMAAFDHPVTLNNDFDQDNTVLSIGRDLRLGDSGWMIGASASYALAEMRFDVGQSDADIEGAGIALHAGYDTGGFFADAQLAGNWYTISYRDAVLTDLANDSDALNTRSQGFGARTELGWRWQPIDGLQVQPLLLAAWEQTDVSMLELRSETNPTGPRNRVFGAHKPSSLRYGLGARVQHQQVFERVQLAYAGTLRAWREQRGDTDVRIQSLGPDVIVSNRFDSDIIDLSLGLGVASRDGRIGGSLRLEAASGDDYDRFAISAGFRYQW